MGQCLCTDPCSQPFIMHPASHVQLVHGIPDFKAPEATTEHAPPFCVRKKKKNLRIRVHVDVEIVCNSSKSATYWCRTCIHCRERCARIAAESREEFIFRIPQATPRHSTCDCQIRSQEEQCAIFPSKNSVSKKCTKFSPKPP